MVLIRHFKLKLNPPLDGTGRRCQMIKRLVCVGLSFTWQDKGALLVPWIVAVTCTTALDFVYAIYLIIFVVNKRPLVWLQLHFANFQSFSNDLALEFLRLEGFWIIAPFYGSANPPSCECGWKRSADERAFSIGRTLTLRFDCICIWFA